jgi:hypothetical protein
MELEDVPSPCSPQETKRIGQMVEGERFLSLDLSVFENLT